MAFSASGASPSGKGVTGYSILQTESMEDAQEMLMGHPHLQWAAGCEIEVHESISWLQADGPGGVLASAAACFNTASKDISGFRMAFDMDEPWATDGNAASVDLQGVATHEMGHVVGIDHTNAPATSCLTMDKFSSLGETQKRSLGLGDKLGMNALYGGGDTTPGPGCNN
jgi:hypothetical protein